MKISVYNLLAKRSAKSKRRRPKLFVETLGDRTLMAASVTASLNVADGILRVEGTYGNDRIHIRHTAGAVRIDGIQIALTDGEATNPAASMARSQITKIVVAALDGNDVVQMHDTMRIGEVAIPLVIHGASGNDTLVGGEGDDTIFGESGVDSILGGNGKDSMYGDANPAAVQVVRDYGLKVDDAFTNMLGKNEKWLLERDVGQEAYTDFYITPDGGLYEYGTYTPSTGQSTLTNRLVATLDPSYYQDIRKLEGARGLYKYDFYYGVGNRNEKWFRGVGDPMSGGWSFITPDGSVYRWDGRDWGVDNSTPTSGTLIATLDFSYLSDPYELVKAAIDDGAVDSINGQDGDDYLDGGVGNDTILGGSGNDSIYGGINPAAAPAAVSSYLGEGVANDSSGGNHGILRGDTVFAPGKVGQAFEFDGALDYVDLGSDPSLDLPGSMSVSLWVRLDTLNHYKYFLGDFVDGNTGQGSLGVVNAFTWFQSYTDGTFGRATGVTSMQLNQWYHLSVVRDDVAKTARLYVNGTEEANLNYAHKTVVTLQGNKILGGSGTTFPNDFMDGQLDEVGIYNRALTYVEIQTLYSAGSTESDDDLLNGQDGDDFLDGGAGNDFLKGVHGDDSLFGGMGNDVLAGFVGADLIDGGDGNDSMWGEGDNDTLIGGSGLDTLSGYTGNDSLVGGGGIDSLLGGDGHDTLDGGDSDDRMAGENGNDVLYGGQGNDDLLGSKFAVNTDVFGANDTIHGGAGRDTLTGGNGHDVLAGEDDNDLLVGGTDNDLLIGCFNGSPLESGNPNDTIYGGKGNDSLYGGVGADQLIGEAGDNLYYGEDGNDTLIGLAGKDIMVAGRGVDSLEGGAGDDELYGEDDGDYMVGGPGFNTLVGGSGSDFIAGGQQADLMCGAQRFSAIELGEANDTMYGYGGNDTIFGGDGNDSMRGGFGNDWLNGEDGDDGIYGEYDNDDLHGGRGTDVLEGDWGDDNLTGGEGLDFLSGGFNNDTLYGADWQNSYTYQDAGNFLYGNDGDDNLHGGNGSDYMEGGANNDGLFGGLGFNTLRGMGGADRFLSWASASDTVSDAETEDATIGFVDSPALTNVIPPAGWPTAQPYNFNAGAWTAAEISSADQAFANLHRLTRNTRLLELPNGTGYVFTRRGQQTSGIYAYGGENDGAGNITIGQLRDPTLTANTMLQTIYHEIGHSWGAINVNSRFSQFTFLSGWVMNPTTTSGLTQGLDADTATPGNTNQWWHRTSARFARQAAPAGDDYSRLSPAEDWGTTWETYFMDKYHGTPMNNNRVQSKYDNIDRLFRDLRS